MRRSIAILGAGNAATALAVLFAKKKYDVRLFSIEPDVTQDINRRHRNEKYLKGIRLPAQVTAFDNVAEAVAGIETIFVAVPSTAIKETLTLALPFLAPKTLIASFSKGLDPDCLLPVADAFRPFLPASMRRRLCVLGGPAVAIELAHGHPAALVIASKDHAAATRIAKLFHGDSIKAAVSSDTLGVGYCMALKNVYAILLGMCDGLHFPMNTKAMLLTLAVEEMEALLKAAGADPRTVLTLAGIGDLLVTGFSPYGRNRTYGERLVGSKTKDPRDLGLTTVEGIVATRNARKLARRLHVKTPLMDTVAKCLRNTHHFERPFVAYLTRLKLS